MPLDNGGRPQPSRLSVSWEPSPLPKRGIAPKFAAQVNGSQTDGRIKMALGMEAGLSQATLC